MAIEIPEWLEKAKQQAIEKFEDVVVAVQDQSPIPDLLNFHTLFMCFFWTAIMIVGVVCGELIGSQVIEDILSFLCDNSSAIALNYFLIPLFVYVKLGSLPENSRPARFILLAAAILQGILTGFLLRHRLPILLGSLHLANVLYIAVVSRVIGPKLNNDRQAYYGIISGIAFVIFVILALCVGMASKSFVLNAIYAVISSHIIIQVYMHRVSQSELKPSYLQLTLLVSSIYAQTFIALLLM